MLGRVPVVVVIGVAFASSLAAADPAAASCGNRRIDTVTKRSCAPCVAGSTNCPCATSVIPLEDCDGADLGGKTCMTEGFFTGTLRCTKQCTLDTRACKRLPGTVGSLAHRVVGKAAPAVVVGGDTNVVNVVAIDGTRTTIRPYNFDLRGPWRKVVDVPGVFDLVGRLAFRREANGFAIGWLDGDRYKHVHTFKGARYLGCTVSNFPNKVVGYEQGGTTYLQLVDQTGAPSGTPLTLPGTLRGLTYVMDGFVVAYTPAAAPQTLEVRWLSPKLQELGAGTLPIAARSLAIAAMASPHRLLVVHADGTGAFATMAALAKHISPDKPMALARGKVRVVGATYTGNELVGLLDSGTGTFTAVSVDTRTTKVTTKQLLARRGAVAHAVAMVYGRVFVAWNDGARLMLSTFSGDLR